MKTWFQLVLLFSAIAIVPAENPAWAKSQSSDEYVWSHGAHFKLNNAGVKKMNEGDFHGAITDFSKAIAAWKSSTEGSSELRNRGIALALSNRALAKKKLQDRQGALADYKEALQSAPTNFMILAPRASLKEELRDYKGAIGDYTELIRLNPASQASYLRSRAKAKFEMGDMAGAHQDRIKASNWNRI